MPTSALIWSCSEFFFFLLLGLKSDPSSLVLLNLSVAVDAHTSSVVIVAVFGHPELYDTILYYITWVGSRPTLLWTRLAKPPLIGTPFSVYKSPSWWSYLICWLQLNQLLCLLWEFGTLHCQFHWESWKASLHQGWKEVTKMPPVLVHGHELHNGIDSHTRGSINKKKKPFQILHSIPQEINLHTNPRRRLIPPPVPVTHPSW